MPSKRKRRNVDEDEDPSPSSNAKRNSTPTTEQTECSWNPFLMAYANCASRTDDAAMQDIAQIRENATSVFDRMLEFTNLSTLSFKKLCSDENRYAVSQLEESIEDLLKFLAIPAIKADESTNRKHSDSRGGNDERTEESTLVTRATAVQVLLPWSIKGVLQAETFKSSASSDDPVVLPESALKVERIYWKTLYTSLSYTLHSNNEEDCPWMTLSTMHKIVPIALKTAINENDDHAKDTFANLNAERGRLARELFCALVEKFYQPSFDVICDSLLPLLASPNLQNSGSAKTKAWLQLSSSVFRLLESRLAKANPKKSFQLLIRPDTFLHLATVLRHLQACKKAASETESDSKQYNDSQDSFRRLASEGFFSLTHHIDGFRSLQLTIPKATNFESSKPDEKRDLDDKTSKGVTEFRCYQEGFLSLLRAFLVERHSKDDTEGIHQEQVVAVADFTTFLLDTFLLQTSKLQAQQQQQKQNVSRKNKAVSKIIQLQFRFVACAIGYYLDALQQSPNPALEDKPFQVAMYKNISLSIKLLLVHNVYRPSTHSIEEKDFLDLIAAGTVNSMLPQNRIVRNSIPNSILMLPSLSTERFSAFEILTVLLQLDHSTLQDRLESILTWCIVTDSEVVSKNTSTASCSRFLVVVIDTFQKLRQLDLFYKAYNASLRVLLHEGCDERLCHLNALSNCDVVSARLANAIQTSPIQQVKHILGNTNESMREMIDSTTSSISKSLSVSASTHLLVGVLRNVRVDSNTHNELLPLVLEVANTTIPRMFESKWGTAKQGGDFFFEALTLCSWTLDAKHRCDFWANTDISSSTEMVVPMSALRSLHTVATVQEENDVAISFPLRKEMRFFACQRIIQLHARMFEKERVAFATENEEFSSRDETLEAQKLAEYVLRSEGSAEEAKELEPRLSLWMILASSIQTWAPHAGSEQIDNFLDFFLRILSLETWPIGRREFDVSVLLRDASFFEIPKVTNRLGRRVVSFIFDSITMLLKYDQDKKSRLLRHVTAGIDQGALFWSDDTHFEVRPKDRSHALALIQKCLAVLQVLKNVLSSIWATSADLQYALQSMLTIDSVVIGGLFPSHSLESTELARLACILRYESSGLLLALCEPQHNLIPSSQHKIIMKQALHSIENTKSAMNKLESEKGRCEFLTASSSLFASTVKYSSMCLQIFPKGALSILNGGSSWNENSEMVAISCGIALFRENRCVDFLGRRDVIDLVERHLWTKAQTYAIEQFGTESLIWNLSVELLAEVLRASPERNGINDNGLPGLDEFMLQIMACLKDNISLSTARCVSYLLSSFGICEPSQHIRQEMVKILFHLYTHGEKVFKTPLCVFVAYLDADELSDFLERLCRGESDHRVTPNFGKVVIFHTLLLTLRETKQLEALSKYASFFLNASLELLAWPVAVLQNEEDVVMSAASLIIDLARRKDVVTIRERDIALVMSSATTALERFHSIVDVDMARPGSEVFQACYSLLSFFLQRFSKQTQSCLSCLIRLLMTMLDFVLYVPMPEATQVECGQKFCRLCELLLPHGEVYKKHVLCLVALFVKGLSDDIDAVRKKSVLNGIYCLLDMIQEHEVKQLNSMLSEMGRALLLSVHEGYKKHTYKGQ